LTSQFDETLVLARRLFRWRNVYYVRRNVTMTRRARAEVPQDVLDIIAERNVLDIELYRYAERALANAIRSYGPTFHEDLARYQAYNAGYQTLHTLLHRVSAPVRWMRSAASRGRRQPRRKPISL